MVTWPTPSLMVRAITTLPSTLRSSTRVDWPFVGLYIGTRTSAERLLCPQQTYDGASPPFVYRVADDRMLPIAWPAGLPVLSQWHVFAQRDARGRTWIRALHGRDSATWFAIDPATRVSFVLLGIERVSMTPGRAPGFTLDFIDWSHSLAAALVWSVLYAALFSGRGSAIARLMGFAVFSHFLLDLPMHPPDLALWPGAGAHLGFGLWHTPFWWWIELAFVAVACGYYWIGARRLRTFGSNAGWACVVVLALHLMNSPWLSAGR